jgi:hypothetical protein
MLSRLSAGLTASGILATITLSLFMPDQAQAIPAFARKYNVNCTTCHTAPPILNQFGQRFLENGYQMPGTEDGGIIGKKKLGDLSLDDVTNYLAFRLIVNAVQNWSVKKENSADGLENKTEFTFPGNFMMYAGGAATKNVGFMVKLMHDIREGGMAVERGFVTFNNLGGVHNLVHLRVGKYDPSTFSSYATVRQQLGGVGASFTGGCAAFSPCTLTRPGLAPSAFATKFYGLYDRSGNVLSPFGAALYNSVAEVGIDIHGRPFGDWFLYQVGILNGAKESFGDSNKGKDIYGMVRFDLARSNDFSANVSGFMYHGNSNAKVQTQDDVNWHRWGVSGRATYKMLDFYAAYAVDKINNTPTALSGLFDSTASGLTIGADAYVMDRLLLSARYDNLDAGGMLDQRKSATFIGLNATYFLRTNIYLFVRDDFNIRRSEGGDHGARNLRNAFFSGVDIVF